MKIVTIAAIAALATLSACTQADETAAVEQVMTDEAADSNVNSNDVAVESEAAK